MNRVATSLEILPVSRPLQGSIRPPGSKSLTNRALITAALAKGPSTLTGVLQSRDTEVMIDSLTKLGVKIQHDVAGRVIEVVGCGGGPCAPTGDLYLDNSGTSIRFLAALCTLGQGTYRLNGNARMQQRPIEDLLVALRQLGASAVCEAGTGCPPVLVHANGLPGGTCHVDTHLSSQFLSALLLAAPCAKNLVQIRLQGGLVSEPYIDMTLGVMARFGVTVNTFEQGVYTIEPQQYTGCVYDIEPDASAASYFFAAAAITGGQVTVGGLTEYALQGDIHFVDALEKMGCQVFWGPDGVTVSGRPLRGIDIDMNGISDTAQTLATVAVFADGPTTIRNVGHIRHKETDRIHAVVTELRRLGIDCDERDDGFTVHPGTPTGGLVETYDDHRMAMSFSLLGLKVPHIHIAHPECTGKTYPEYFADLDRLCTPSR